ncbi:MAG: SufS family cysteine desulfurase [Gemmatimonadota bacterium]
MPDTLTLPRFDVAALRAEFPMLGTLSRGKPIAYLDSAATAQKPRAVLDRMQEFYETSNANIHRGVYQASEQATMAYDGVRETVAEFLGGVAAEEVIFVRGTTEAINLVAQSFLRPTLRPNDWVLVTAMEHHANIVPWQLVGARTVPIPMLDSGVLDLAAAAELLAQGPRVLAVAHVSNALGTINPIAELASLAREHQVPVLVDGAQAAPHLTLDIPALGVDFYCFSGHKVYGPTGVGVLWARAEHLERMPPWQGGGDMIDRVTFEGTTFAAAPQKFEAGTPDIAGVIGLGAAIDWLVSQDRAAMSAHEQELLRLGRELLQTVPGVRVVSAPDDNVGVLTFTMDGAHPHDIASLLDQDGICVRAGHHCTQPLHARLGIWASVRASLGPYSTEDEVRRLAKSLHRIRGVFS